jgi:hypothetical protein
MRCAKIYKLTTSNSNGMDITQFDMSVSKLFLETHKQEMEKLQNRVAEIKMIYKTKKRNFIEGIKGTDHLLEKLTHEIRKARVEKQENDRNTLLTQDKSLEQIQKNGQDQSIAAPSYNNPVVIPQEPVKSIGGNPINPQISLRRQVEAENKYLELNEILKTDTNSNKYPINSPIKNLPTPTDQIRSKIKVPDVEKMNEEEKFQKSPEIRILVKEKQIIQDKIFKLEKKLGDQKLIEKEATEFVKNRVKLSLTIL